MGSWLRRAPRARGRNVMQLLGSEGLAPVFQPMVDLRTGIVLGQEALVRPPRTLADTSLEDLWKTAEKENCLQELELACLEAVMEQWSSQIGKGKLFVNFSAQSLVQLQQSQGTAHLLQLMHKHHINPKLVGLDVSGYTRVHKLDALLDALSPLRAAGVTVALDNFSASEKSMNAWSVLLPNMVKMAPRWTHNIATESEQSRMVRSLVRIARTQNALLVAKSVETGEELLTMKALEVDIAQGFFLGSPSLEPARSLNLRARDALGSGENLSPPTTSAMPMTSAADIPPELAHRYSLLN